MGAKPEVACWANSVHARHVSSSEWSSPSHSTASRTRNTFGILTTIAPWPPQRKVSTQATGSLLLAQSVEEVGHLSQRAAALTTHGVPCTLLPHDALLAREPALHLPPEGAGLLTESDTQIVSTPSSQHGVCQSAVAIMLLLSPFLGILLCVCVCRMGEWQPLHFWTSVERMVPPFRYEFEALLAICHQQPVTISRGLTPAGSYAATVMGQLNGSDLRAADCTPPSQVLLGDTVQRLVCHGASGGANSAGSAQPPNVPAAHVVETEQHRLVGRCVSG